MRAVQLASLIGFGLAGFFLAAPRLNRLNLADALSLLLSVHVFRVVALFVIQAQHDGYQISNTAVTEIVVGDLAGAAIAAVSIMLLRKGARLGVLLSWLLIFETVIDIAVGIHRKVLEPIRVGVAGPLWPVLAVFVPLMIVTLPLLAWQLITRGKDSLSNT
ncbi:hypothetical protein [Phenylobacterium sp.]|uniref:hypothetical protein n=1 Tax=Phenylobacterium sp. TaxID=1871053 RepID=UPI00120C6887|nr:hypothetical protein [Phenylobacterium sp.]THD57470.1 MAG: hypothetical protein E8A49_22775 [Phenylobacterium sp.]